MYKSFFNMLKSMGKKAVGYVRGLNGDKAAAFGSSVLSNYVPVWAQPLKTEFIDPYIKQLGQYANDRMDEWSADDKGPRESGVHKPLDRRSLRIKKLRDSRFK
jgi:hypothetical protein